MTSIDRFFERYDFGSPYTLKINLENLIDPNWEEWIEQVKVVRNLHKEISNWSDSSIYDVFSSYTLDIWGMHEIDKLTQKDDLFLCYIVITDLNPNFDFATGSCLFTSTFRDVAAIKFWEKNQFQIPEPFNLISP